jgi:hypothetical protein
VTESAALYQQYLPIGCVRSPLRVSDHGTQGFWVCDPFNNILIFSEPLDARDGDAHERD